MAGSRKTEIRQRLSELGTGADETGDRNRFDVISAVGKFAEFLADSGHVFAQFGRYLGTRIDCFPPAHCQILCRTGRIDPLTGSRLIERMSPEAAPRPWMTRLTPDREASDHLIHVYNWDPDPDVVFRLVNPNFVASWPSERELLRLMSPAIRRLWPHVPVSLLIDQFRKEIESSLDFEGELAWRKRVASEEPAGGHWNMLAPDLEESLTRKDITAILRNEPDSMQSVLDQVPLHPWGSPFETARILCLSWLSQTFKGSWFPVFPSTSNFGITDAGQVIFFGGRVASVTPDLRERLFDHLLAVESDDPNEATSILLTMARAGNKSANTKNLRDRIRQIVPFRDSGWSSETSQECLAEQVFTQWRFATECGFESPPAAVQFYRSFWGLALLCRQLTPNRDVFREALQEFRRRAAFGTIRDSMTLGNVAGLARDWATFMIELPDKLGAIAGQSSAASSSMERDRKTGGDSTFPAWVVIGCHLLVMASIGLLLKELSVPQDNHPILFLGFGSFILVGFLLLRYVLRER